MFLAELCVVQEMPGVVEMEQSLCQCAVLSIQQNQTSSTFTRLINNYDFVFDIRSISV